MPVVGFTVSDEDVAESNAGSNKSTFGPGNYKFVITDVETGASPVKGTPRLEVKMIVEHDGYDFKMFDDIYLTDNAKWRYIQFCKSLGFDPTQDIDTDDMSGKKESFAPSLKTVKSIWMLESTTLSTNLAASHWGRLR